MDVRPGYKHTEVGVIPEDWEVSTVGREFDIQLGKMLDSEKNVGVLKPYLGNKSVQWGRVETAQLPLMRFSPLDLPRFRLKRGDLLVCEGGEVGRAALWEDQVSECYYQKALHRLRARSGFDSRLMIDLLRFWSAQDKLSDYVTQTSIAHLTKEKFAQIWLPIPPEREQRAIATALSDVDALIAKLDQLIAKKRDLKQAAMQQLLTGRTRLPRFSGEWEVKRLGDIASIRNQKVLPSQVDPDTTCVELEHVGQGDGRLLANSSAQYSTSTKYRFVAGDVLFGRLRAYLRKYWLADRDGICTTEIWPLTCAANHVERRFLFALVQSDAFVDAASVSYGTHMPRADWSVMRNFELRLPGLREQAAIANLLSDMDAEISALEARRDKIRAVKEGMMQVLLTGQVRLPVSAEPMEALA